MDSPGKAGRVTNMILQSTHLYRYPRTLHLQGSRLQHGDGASDMVPLAALKGKHVVIEEKIDGANAGISYSEDYAQLLQSRGHYLSGGGSERQFNLFKLWAKTHEAALLERLEDRYILYGEWAYSKHSIYYDQLPHYFHEFDILDRVTGEFLSTPRRLQLLHGSPVLSVPVLYEGVMIDSVKALWKLVRHSLAKSDAWKRSFESIVQREGLPLELTWQQTDKANLAEGLYIKVEDEYRVLARYKLVRQDFVQTILDSGSHHSQRPIVPNQLAPAVDIYAPTPTIDWYGLGLQTLNDPKQVAQLSDVVVAGSRKLNGR